MSAASRSTRTRRAVAIALTALCAVGAPSPAFAYLKYGVRVGANVVDVKWNQPIAYFVTERGGPGVTVVDFQAAVRRAFDSWQAVPTANVRASFQGFTIAPPAGPDGRTTFGFLDRPDLDRVLAATSFVLDSTTGAIIEADVFFNTRFNWSTAPGGETGRTDVESIALHEIGHLLGLGHSALGETEMIPAGRRVLATGAIMFPIAFSAGTIADRQPQRDDIAGISDLYPTQAFLAETGSISGRVLKNGQGVLGAHVVAFNLETGALIGNYTLTPQGDFVIAGLDPGRHVIRVEPLDDADTESFFSGPIDVNFKVAFAPQLVNTAAGGGSDEIVIQVVPK
jgi:hypothetical protein